MAPPMKRPANADASVSRVALSNAPSPMAEPNAAAIALGGASKSLCRSTVRAQISSAASAATGSTSALMRSGIMPRTP